MPETPNKLSQFWQELKRRRVVRVIAMYAATAFIIMEAGEIMLPRLGLPDWTVTFIIVLLIVGFPITIILSWIFDITPEGIKKTETVKAVKEKQAGAKPSKRKLRVSDVIIAVLLVAVVILVYPKIFQKNKVEDIAEKSIAVRPFWNESIEKENEFFVNGMTEDIRINLSKIADLRVLSRGSVEKYRDTQYSTIDIARDLNVTYVLEGTAQRIENQVKIHVQLILAQNDDHIWENSYKEDIKDATQVFDIQNQIAQSVAKEINAIITPEEKQLINKVPTTNLTAYDFYQRGIEEHFRYWEKYDLYHINKSIDYFSKAIELDPEYSLAYTGMARGYWMLGHYATKPLPDHWNESKRLSNKAIELDPENSLAYAHLGVVQHNWDWDSSAARYSIEKALTISPNNDDCYISLIFLEYRLGNCNKLASLIKKWSKINSHVNPPSTNLMLLTCQQDFEKIRRIADIKWNSNTGIQTSFYFYVAYVNNGNYDKALKIAESIEDKSNDPSISLSIKGHILAKMGDREGAVEILENLSMLSDSRSISNILFANIYDALGDKDRTLEYLERALNERDWRIHAFWDPTAFNLINKNEPWLKDFVQRLWVPQNDTAIVSQIQP
jgi:TolB-like protein